MESFGVVMARLVAEWVMVMEALLSRYVNITVVDGNVTNIAVTPLGESFADAWSGLIVTFAWTLDDLLQTLWSVQ